MYYDVISLVGAISTVIYIQLIGGGNSRSDSEFSSNIFNILILFLDEC